MKRNEMKYISREVENRLVHVFFLGGTFENECSLRFSSYKTGMKAQGLKDESNGTQGKQEMVCFVYMGCEIMQRFMSKTYYLSPKGLQAFNGRVNPLTF